MSENNDEYLQWSLPDLDNDDKNIEKSKNTLFGKPAAWYQGRQNTTEVDQEDLEIQPQPLTLDDIEEIRQSAYEDGFKEGREAGMEKGLEEGKKQGLEEGQKEGLEQGLEQGLTQGEEQVKIKVKQWDTLLTRLHNPLQLLDENVEYQLVTLAQHLAEQMCRVELKTDPKIILQALKQAIEALPISGQKLKILLHPEDLLFVQQVYSAEVCSDRGWDLYADPALLRGDCQIQSETSSIDYAFNTRVDQVLKQFLQKNYQHMPKKNDDSSLLNNTPMPTQEEIETELSDNENSDLDTDISSTESDGTKELLGNLDHE